MERIGLIAGSGLLPVEFAQSARKRQIPVFAVGAVTNVDPNLSLCVSHYQAIPLIQWGSIVGALQRAGVRRVYVLGKVPKTLIFEGAQMDARFQSVLAQAQDGRDDHLFHAFAADLASEGIEIGDQSLLLPELFPGSGVMGGPPPTEAEWRDIHFGCQMAKGAAGLDIGQTVVVKAQAVLAVEAIEGTDEAIRRGGHLGGGGAVAVKVTKPAQDPRFDVPAIGPGTVAAMAEAGVRVLAVEANRTFVMRPDDVRRLAKQHGLAVVTFDAAAS